MRRLWTPWRLQYVAGDAKEAGCIFCNRLSADDDVRSLILHRGPRAFVIMNLFPYNTGHTMLIPNEHVASPEDADPESLTELATILPPLLRASRRALACHGFNTGLNVGSIAGAGVADHMHQHLVPRWNGDANFMPIIASTIVIPELIPVTYAKLRAELARELNPERFREIPVVILDPGRRRAIVDGDGELPRIELARDRSVAQEAIGFAVDAGLSPTLAGWSGETRAHDHDDIALTLIATGEPGGALRWVEIEQSAADRPPGDRRMLERALANLAPTIGS